MLDRKSGNEIDELPAIPREGGGGTAAGPPDEIPEPLVRFRCCGNEGISFGSQM
jgi:hypothetical protein